jgi:hypothetical protein
MKITLKTKVVHGTDRGGEDLFLVVKVASRKDPRTLDAAKEARTAFEKAWGSLPHENEIRAGEGAEDLFRVGQDGLSSNPTEQYDFKVEDTKERLWTEILDLVEGDEWKLALKSGQYGVQKRIYVDGNAE